uniref:Uncharacterized protein n=1 Tax=Anguilla anguilla TaxID=7936 RepID=A0A0E9WWY6_ANGAN
MVKKKTKKQKKTKPNTYSVKEGAKEIITNFGTEICTQFYSLEEIRLCIKKRRALDIFPTSEDAVPYTLSSFLFFLYNGL